MNRFVETLLRPNPGHSPRSILAQRAVTGWVFMSSGIMKFLFWNQGPGRFAKLGFPAPEAVAYFVGGVEVVAGALLVLGLFSRLACIPLCIDMVVAIVSTKLPLLFGTASAPAVAAPNNGFWEFAYQSRLDFSMLFSCGYLAAVGAGLWSLDAVLSRRRSEGNLMARVAAEA